MTSDTVGQVDKGETSGTYDLRWAGIESVGTMKSRRSDKGVIQGSDTGWRGWEVWPSMRRKHWSTTNGGYWMSGYSPDQDCSCDPVIYSAPLIHFATPPVGACYRWTEDDRRGAKDRSIDYYGEVLTQHVVGVTRHWRGTDQVWRGCDATSTAQFAWCGTDATSLSMEVDTIMQATSAKMLGRMCRDKTQTEWGLTQTRLAHRNNLSLQP